MKSTPWTSRTIASAAAARPASTSTRFTPSDRSSTPIWRVSANWGSPSTMSTRRPWPASRTPRFAAVVVFPTPPFWLLIVTTSSSASFVIVWERRSVRRLGAERRELRLLGEPHSAADGRRARREHPAEALARPPGGRGRCSEDELAITVDCEQFDWLEPDVERALPDLSP